MPQPKHSRRRRSKKERVVLFLAIFLFICAGGVAAWKCFARPPAVDDDDPSQQSHEHDPGSNGQNTVPGPAQKVQRDNCFTILLSGLDDHNGGSDTNILVMVDVEKGEINALSVPRDTLIHTDWNVPKFNSAYNVGGVERLQSELSNLLGIPINFYVTVDLAGFVELVDAIGGVNFEVPVDMNYDDPTQDLHIHFKKGMQYLNGEDALKVVRWRHNNDPSQGYPNGDLGRVETQQKFLLTVARQMISNISIDALSTYADLFMTYIQTDLTIGNLVWLGQQAFSMGIDNIHFHTLPGEGKTLNDVPFWDGSYYVLDAQAVLDLVNTSFNPYSTPLALEDMDILVPEQPAP